MSALRACLLATLAAASAAAWQKPAPAPARPEPARMILPKGAVPIGAATYSYTDPQGKKWIYRDTPFGLARAEDQGTLAAAQAPADPQTLAKQLEQIKTHDAGDSVRFERKGPFGVYRWTARKTNLGPLEQAAWDRDRARPSEASERE